MAECTVRCSATPAGTLRSNPLGADPAEALHTGRASSNTDVGGRFRMLWWLWARNCEVPSYDGTEGELYDQGEDPLQRINRWADPGYRSIRDELWGDLADHLPPERRPGLRVAAPT